VPRRIIFAELNFRPEDRYACALVLFVEREVSISILAMITATIPGQTLSCKLHAENSFIKREAYQNLTALRVLGDSAHLCQMSAIPIGKGKHELTSLHL
jgi:hypothetical protein